QRLVEGGEFAALAHRREFHEAAEFHPRLLRGVRACIIIISAGRDKQRLVPPDKHYANSRAERVSRFYWRQQRTVVNFFTLGWAPVPGKFPMACKRAIMSVLLAAGLVAATLMPARADPAYVAFPPFWPLITLGWIAESAAAVATAPFRPYYCPPCYGAPPPY